MNLTRNELINTLPNREVENYLFIWFLLLLIYTNMHYTELNK